MPDQPGLRRPDGLAGLIDNGMITSYDNVMRTIIDLPEMALHELDSLCKRERISRAEAIRRAVRNYLRQQQPRDADQQAFGLWRDRAISGTDYEDALRDEWPSNEPGH